MSRPCLPGSTPSRRTRLSAQGAQPGSFISWSDTMQRGDKMRELSGTTADTGSGSGSGSDELVFFVNGKKVKICLVHFK